MKRCECTRFHIMNQHTLTNCSAKRNREQSPLLRLPAELRNEIWAYILEEHRPSWFYLDSSGGNPLLCARSARKIMRVGSTCCQMRVEVSLRLFNQISVRCGMFRRWVAALTAEQCSVIRKVRVDENDTKRPGFWLAVGKLSGLEKLFVNYHDFGYRELSIEETEEDSVFREKLDCTVGHEVNLEKVYWRYERRESGFF
jgi:hypothetical protein